MEIAKVALQEDGSYQVNDNVFVPDDMGNRHRVMIQEWIDAGNTPTPYVVPEKSWEEKRTAKMADGGYGIWSEQLEMIGEQGMTVYQAHIASVKAAHRKP
jgi:hypothetical protein